jgi:hypothetical protein
MEWQDWLQAIESEVERQTGESLITVLTELESEVYDLAQDFGEGKDPEDIAADLVYEYTLQGGLDHDVD